MMKKWMRAAVALTAACVLLPACGRTADAPEEAVTAEPRTEETTTAALTSAPPAVSASVSATAAATTVLITTTALTTDPVLTTAVPETTAAPPVVAATPAPQPAPTDSPRTGTFDASDLSVRIRGVSIAPDTAWSAYASAFGTADAVTNAPSCHFDGMDTIYEYSGFSVYTYANGDENYVYDIEISSPAISTNKGIAVGASAEDVVAAYGGGYVSKTDTMIEYRAGGQSLYFSLDDDSVSLIEYYAE